MEKSKFQFTNPILKYLKFDIHDDFEKKGRLDMKIELSVKCQRERKVDEDKNESACVSVFLSIGSQDNSTPFYVEAEEEAVFRWEAGTIKDERVEALLNQNAVALLIGYLRPIISNITAASPYPAYNLPFIDLTAKKEVVKE